MIVPKGLKYTENHEWVKIEGKLARIGITDYAQEELGEVVYVELPDIERYLEQSSGLGVVESVKSVSEIYTPLSGKVIEINQELSSQPQLINQDPYGKGWLVVLEVDLEANFYEIDQLMTADEYENLYGHKPVTEVD